MQSMAMSKQDKQTYDNVREFFKTDFERYRQLAELADLKGVSYEGIASKDNVNHQESKVITAVYCKNIVDTVKSIIERMHDERYTSIVFLNIYLFGKLVRNCNIVNQQSRLL